MPRDVYVPDFEVRIDGVKIPDELRRVVTSVSLTTGLEGADRVEMVVTNQARFWVDDPRLEVRPKGEKYQPLELHLGYLPGALEPMFFGELTGLTASFPSSGVPQLTVTAQDKRHRMKESKRSEKEREKERERRESKRDEKERREAKEKEREWRRGGVLTRGVVTYRSLFRAGIEKDASDEERKKWKREWCAVCSRGLTV